MSIALITSQSAMADDLGAVVEKYLNSNSEHFFGIKNPLSASEKVNVPRKADQKGGDLVKLSVGLRAEIVSRKLADSSSQLVLWPNNSAPTHVISVVEDGRDPGSVIVGKYASGRDKFAPSVQRLNLKTGAVDTILRGLSSLDSIRRTPWNTIVVAEERSDGGLYEILDPLRATDLTVVARGASDVIDSTDQAVIGQVQYRDALGNLSWEGLDITKDGVVYYGDELRPGNQGADTDGGSVYKFVPSTPWSGTALSDLNASPLASGNVYAFQASAVGKGNSLFPQFGQGSEVGQGAWVKVDPTGLNGSASVQGASGYYRPSDGRLDPSYKGPGVKYVWNNSGNEEAQNYGETLSLIDANPLGTGEKTVDNPDSNANGLSYLADSAETSGLDVAVVTRVLEGNPEFSQFDNLAFQPGTGRSYISENRPGDKAFNDIYAVLPDGFDRDNKFDGFAKVLSVRDSSAEPAGLQFTADGRTAYLTIHHSKDDAFKGSENDGYATDDLIKITGFQVKR